MGIGERGWSGWGRAGGLAVATVLLAAGCAQESDRGLAAGQPADFAATPQFLRASVERSTDETFHFETTMSMAFDDGSESIDVEVPFFSGAQDGERFRTEMDLGAMAETMARQTGEEIDPGDLPPGDDLGIETVGDAETMYIRAPMFATLAEGMPPPDDLGADAAAAFEVFREMGDAWGRIDLTALGDVAPGDLRNSAASGQAMDPMVLFELVSDADEVEELGRSEVDGVPVHGLAAQTSLADLLAAQGTDSDDLAQQVGGMDELPEAVFDAEVSVEVWIDDDGLVRRLAFAYGPELFTGVAEATGEDVDEVEGAEVGFSFDFFGYGDPVDIQFPDDADTVDVTEAFTTLAELSDP